MKPTKPLLWNRIKKKHRASKEGGEAGRWSARKNVLAKLEYKERGGGWKETKPPKPGK
jgi:hypothetical protein